MELCELVYLVTQNTYHIADPLNADTLIFQLVHQRDQSLWWKTLFKNIFLLQSGPHALWNDSGISVQIDSDVFALTKEIWQTKRTGWKLLAVWHAHISFNHC